MTQAVTSRSTVKPLAALLAVVAFAAVSSGCAIHTQGPIREVAYDFSDHQFYDRAYAPSPAYVSAPASNARRTRVLRRLRQDPAHYGAVFKDTLRPRPAAEVRRGFALDGGRFGRR